MFCMSGCRHPDLSEAVLQRADGITGRVSRETELLALLKRPGGDPVQVPITDPTPKAGKGQMGLS